MGGGRPAYSLWTPPQYIENLVLRGWNDHTTCANAMKASIGHPRVTSRGS